MVEISDFTLSSKNSPHVNILRRSGESTHTWALMGIFFFTITAGKKTLKHQTE